jgi:hypothetical protein
MGSAYIGAVVADCEYLICVCVCVVCMLCVCCVLCVVCVLIVETLINVLQGVSNAS